MYGEGQWGVPGYTEVRELGSGAAGRVVLATRDHDGVEVAIKYLNDELRSDMGFVARFRHEARLIGTLQSSHHARLIDYVESGQGAAIVMELVNGVSLREILRSEGPTGAQATLVALKGSLQGLAAAHSIGVVHRDFKPENVMVQGDGVSKLVDFGIAVRAGEGVSAAGTPPYMAPEQWAGGPAGPTTDVYAATVVFFECLTGTRPYRAPNIAALARQHQSAPPRVEEVPQALQGLVERGLAKQPDERPPSAEAFLTELEAIAAEAYGADWEERGRRRLAALAGLLMLLFPSPLHDPVETQTALTETRFPDPARLLSKLSAKVAIGAVAVGVVVTVGVILVNSSTDEPVLRAQTSEVTPSGADPVIEEPTEEEPTEEPTATPEETTSEPDPTPTSTAPAVSTSPPVLPTATASPSPSRTPRPTPTRKPTRKPVRTPTPTDSPEPDITGKNSTTSNGSKPTSAAPTPTPTPTSAPPTRTPPTRTPPTSTPPTSTPPSQTQEPTPTRTSTDDGDGGGGTQTPTLDQVGKAQAGLLALGLMTSGAVPVTLAVKRRMTGRHRKQR
ncbi:serine/threonine protein kinase [Nonomuraea sp. WAC 01424]|uniref:serine/threonine-protein kinase n=1 Tax=Nonomuraea sp. WAC 01424 TaxID=2203200 RepID=UPI000F772303|nr:serine/threonine-protein kinase [Nonomuraea sp. WAC 01424]RSN07444.1 serine/threonine protein kinase [Nonomuraea sp. WAC 01424]